MTAAAAVDASLFKRLDAESRRTRLARFCLIFSRIVFPLLVVPLVVEVSDDDGDTDAVSLVDDAVTSRFTAARLELGFCNGILGSGFDGGA